MAIAGYKGRAKITGVSGVAMTDEAMTDSGDGLTFFTAAATKNFWDPRVAPVVEADGVLVASGYAVDYLMGKIVFGVAPTKPVTVTGSYLPLNALPACKSYSMAISANLLDRTVLGDEATARLSGLKDASGTLERLESGLEDYTTGVSLWDVLTGGSPAGLEIRTNEATSHATRCYALINANNLAGGVADLATASVTFTATTWANSAAAVLDGDPTT